MIPKDKIALFIGNDVTAHLVLNKIVPEIRKSGYEPVIFLPSHRAPKTSIPQELKDAAFLERRLTNEVVYPFLAEHPYPGEDKNLSPKDLGKRYDLSVETVDDVNDQKFVQRIKDDPLIVGGLSVRCFQIFQPEIIEVFKDRQFFLNLHPGILPKFRGVMSTVRAMAAEEKEYGWTLHHIEKGIDTGDILWVSARKLDLSKTGLLAQVDVAALGAESIKRALDELDRGNILKGHPQDPSKGQYFTYPTPEELAQWKKQGIKLADATEVQSLLVDKFSDASIRNGRMLSAAIGHAIEQWKRSQESDNTGTEPSENRVCQHASRLIKSRVSPTGQLNFGT